MFIHTWNVSPVHIAYKLNIAVNHINTNQQHLHSLHKQTYFKRNYILIWLFGTWAKILVEMFPLSKILISGNLVLHDWKVTFLMIHISCPGKEVMWCEAQNNRTVRWNILQGPSFTFQKRLCAPSSSPKNKSDWYIAPIYSAVPDYSAVLPVCHIPCLAAHSGRIAPRRKVTLPLLLSRHCLVLTWHVPATWCILNFCDECALLLAIIAGSLVLPPCLLP